MTLDTNTKEWRLHMANMLVKGRELDLQIQERVGTEFDINWANKQLETAIEGLRNEIINVYHYKK